MGAPKFPKLNDKERGAIEDMANGGLLYVYVDGDGGTEGSPSQPDWPMPGSGAIVYDGPPVRITRRLVRRIQRLGTDWCTRTLAEVLTDEGKVKARALLDKRDVWILSPLPAAQGGR
ncbi:hypothetical protein [Methylobacterium sp. CM6247]